DENAAEGLRWGGFGKSRQHNAQLKRLLSADDARLKQKLLIQLSSPKISHHLLSPGGDAHTTGGGGSLHSSSHRLHPFHLRSPTSRAAFPSAGSSTASAILSLESCIVACMHIPNYPVWLSLRAPADGVVLMQQYLTLLSELRLSYQAVASQLVRKMIAQRRRRAAQRHQQVNDLDNSQHAPPSTTSHRDGEDELFTFVECQTFGDVCYVLSHVPDIEEEDNINDDSYGPRRGCASSIVKKNTSAAGSTNENNAASSKHESVTQLLLPASTSRTLKRKTISTMTRTVQDEGAPVAL
ncbi:Hypothetical protein, putative, partial [Bodo saltans]